MLVARFSEDPGRITQSFSRREGRECVTRETWTPGPGLSGGLSENQT